MAQAVHDAFSDLRSAGLPFRWVAPERYHLTLRFLGEVAEDAIAPLAAATDQVAHRPAFAVSLTEPGVFSGRGSVRVLWAGIDSPGLVSLAGALDQALEDAGFEVRDGTFAPHLTVARVKRNARLRRSSLQSHLDGVRLDGGFTAREVAIMKSALGPGGPRYSTLHASPFLDEAGPRGGEGY